MINKQTNKKKSTTKQGWNDSITLVVQWVTAAHWPGVSIRGRWLPLCAVPPKGIFLRDLWKTLMLFPDVAGEFETGHKNQCELPGSSAETSQSLLLE